MGTNSSKMLANMSRSCFKPLSCEEPCLRTHSRLRLTLSASSLLSCLSPSSPSAHARDKKWERCLREDSLISSPAGSSGMAPSLGRAASKWQIPVHSWERKVQISYWNTVEPMGLAFFRLRSSNNAHLSTSMELCGSL